MTAAPHLTETPLSRVLAKLPGYKRQGKGFAAKCPAHKDGTPSLSVAQGRDGRVVLTCHKGCPPTDIVQAIGLAMSDLFAPKAVTTFQPPIKHEGRPARVAVYDYTDPNGNLLYKVNRFEPGLDGGDKSFVPEHPDGTKGYPEGPRVLYKLPEVLDAIDNGRTVYLVEGEKCAEFLREEGYTATCHAGGSKAWRDEYAAPLKGADVVILLDNDDTGKSWGEQAAAAITNAGGVSVRVVELPGLTKPKEDIVEWLTVYDHTLDELQEIVGRTRIWSPDPSKRTRWRLDELLVNDVIMRPPAPVVPRLAWRSMSTLFAAREKSGKSTLMGHVAAAVSRGHSFLGDPCVKGTVLIVGLEEFIGNAARRLREFDAEPSRIYLVDKLPTDPRERPAAVREHIEAVDPVLVIVDTLMAYGRGQITDANNAAQMEPVVAGLTDLAHQTGCALVLVHHGKKADGGYRDSTAIGAAVDVVAEMFQPKDAATEPTKREIRVVGRVPVHNFAFRYVGSQYVLDHGDRAPLDQQIVAIVRERPGCSANDVADAIPGRRQEVLSLMASMLNDGRLRDLGNSARARKLYVSASMLPEGVEP